MRPAAGPTSAAAARAALAVAAPVLAALGAMLGPAPADAAGSLQPQHQTQQTPQPPGGVAGRTAGAAQLGTWTARLYVPSRPPPSATIPAPSRGRTLPPEAACIDAILTAERRQGIETHTLLAIGFTEAGRRTRDRLFTVWPWTVNAAGEGRVFETRDEAIAFVRDRQAAGVRSIDVGCLQVNLRWHPDAFPDLLTAFEPQANADYAARYLVALGAERGSLQEAVARYHSAQSELGEAYRQRVEGNRRWVAHAIAYLEALAHGPQTVPAAGGGGAGGGAAGNGAAPARPAYSWATADLGRLSFLASLYADGPVRPLLPPVRE